MSDYTTPEPAIDIVEFIPELAEYARTTTRLHPHPTETDPPADQSKFGGMFLWPADEPWPMCMERNVPFVPVLQLRSDDFPDVEFMSGTDLFQLLWTPYREEATYLPRPVMYWRSASDVTDPLPAAPSLADHGIDPADSEISDNIPAICTVHPEKVTEYPDPDRLYWWAGSAQAEAILDKINNTDFPIPEEIANDSEADSVEELRTSYYWSNLSQCPGAKVLGGGSTDTKGVKWEHFISLPSWEYDAGSYFRWQPLEDRQERRGIHFEGLKAPLGTRFGRTQDVEIWVCRETDPWKISMHITQ